MEKNKIHEMKENFGTKTGTFNKGTIGEVKAEFVKSEAQTAEGILKGSFTDPTFHGEFAEYKTLYPTLIKSVLKAMEEYASLKSKEAHNKAIQQAIEKFKYFNPSNEATITGRTALTEKLLSELEKLKSE